MTAPVIPVSSNELAEILMDKKKMDPIYADPDSFKTFLNNYAKAANAPTHGDIERIVDERLQAGLASFAANTKTDIRRPDMRPATVKDVKDLRQTGAAYNRDAMGAKLDGEYKDLTDFFATINHRADRSAGTETRKRIDTLKNALGSTVPSDGGFLIPEEFRAELLRVSLESAVVRPRARVIPMASLRIALPMLDSTTNASSVFGGIIAYWTEEAAALTQSSPSFAKIVLDAKKLTLYSDIPNELGDDSAISLEAFLSQAYPEACAWYEDAAFGWGTGVGEPLGALATGNSALVAVAKETGQAAVTIVWQNIVKMYARMLPSSLARAVWVVSPDTFPELATMALNVGTGGSAIWLNNGQTGPPMTILGRPVIVTEKASILGTQGDISFVDFAYYLIGDRMAMTGMTSPHYKFGNDVTSYRLIERVDGQPWLKSAITPKNSGPTLSPFVQLAVRA